MELLFKYYAVTSLSMRGALHRLLAEEAWLLPKMWFEKDVHPSCVGSKCARQPSLLIPALLSAAQDCLCHECSKVTASKP